MKTFATNDARKAPRIGSLAMISGAMLGAAGLAGPAFSADLPEFYLNGYDTGCYPCAPRPVLEERPVVEQAPVERHWVQRDYIERRYESAWYPGYRYSHYYPGPGSEVYDTCRTVQWERCGQNYQGYEAPPARHFSYEGDYVAPYRYASHHDYRPYEYGYRSYEHPRPPASVPNSYYGPYYK